MITNYYDYITESKLQLLLEAKIVFTTNFMEVLDKIESPIAKKLISLRGEDKDIDRNYIDINKDKIDSILFKPQDKIDKVKYKILSKGAVYATLSKMATSIIHNFAEPRNGEQGIITRTLTVEELNEISPGGWKYIYDNGDSMVVFQFGSGSDIFDAITKKSNLVKDYASIRSTDVNVGRFIRAFLTKLGEKFTDVEIESFVDQYKKVLQMEKDIFVRFKEVKGDEIKTCYLVDNYESESGSLGGSCMRYDRCQDYFDIYVNNPERVSLVVLLSEQDSSKIAGRALIWLDDKGRRIMDRIYTIRTADILLFIEYCDSKGYYYKESQNYSATTPLVHEGIELDYEESGVVITLKKGGYSPYPYMDTMKYFNPDTGVISNRNSAFKPSYYYIELTDTDGGPHEDDNCCAVCSGVGVVDCPECEGRREIDCPACNGSGGDAGSEPCSVCHGGGTVRCDICDGDGRVDCPECT
jgi:hypothetical protein